MKSSPRWYGALIAAIIAVLVAIFYLIPGISHPRPMGGATTDPAVGMAIIFFVIAGIAVAMALVARSQSENRR